MRYEGDYGKGLMNSWTSLQGPVQKVVLMERESLRPSSLKGLVDVSERFDKVFVVCNKPSNKFDQDLHLQLVDHCIQVRFMSEPKQLLEFILTVSRSLEKPPMQHENVSISGASVRVSYPDKVGLKKLWAAQLTSLFNNTQQHNLHDQIYDILKSPTQIRNELLDGRLAQDTTFGQDLMNRVGKGKCLRFLGALQEQLKSN